MFATPGARARPRKVAPNIRTRLTRATTFYIDNVKGNNNNNGLSPGRAFRSIQSALNAFATNYDQNGQIVLFQLTSGQTYTEAIVLPPYFSSVSGNTNVPTIIGDATSIATAANYIVNGNGGIAFLGVNTITPWTIKGLSMASTGSICVEADINSTINVHTVRFSSATIHMATLYGGSLEVLGPYAIDAGAVTHIQANNRGMWLIQPGNTVTLNSTPAFSNAFVQVTDDGVVVGIGTTFSGNATGTRWLRDTRSTLSSSVAPDSFWPGNANGATTALPVTDGGTNATTASNARTQLGVSGRTTGGDSNLTLGASNLPFITLGAGLTAARTWLMPAPTAAEPGSLLAFADGGGIAGANTLTFSATNSAMIGVGVSSNSVTFGQTFANASFRTDGVSAWYITSRSS